MKRRLFAPLLLMFALTTLALALDPPFNGQWWMEPSNDHSGQVQVTLRFERHSGDSTWNSVHTFDMLAEKAVGLNATAMQSGGEHVQFKLVRDAGNFNCDGWFASGKGSGTYKFEPNAQFASELQKRGLGAPTDEQQFRMAQSDTSLAFVDSLKAAGYQFDIDELVKAVNHGITDQYVRDINAVGYHPATLHDLIRMRDHGVTADYVKALQASGLKDIPAEQAIRLRDHGVSADYINGLAKLGVSNIEADSLVQLRDHGVTPEFIAEMRKSGLNVPPREMARLRDHGVSVEYISDLSRLGITDLDSDALVHLRDHGVSPEFVAEVRKAGLKASPRELSQLRDHGVSADFVREVRNAGFTNASVSDLTRLRDHGISASYIQQHGRNHSIDDVIRMHDRGGDDGVI